KIDNLQQELSRELHNYAKEFDVTLETTSLSTELHSLIERIARKNKKAVVVLIDEYDKPIVDFLTDLDKAESNQAILRDFFSPLKKLEASGHLHFLFITGVSKFSKVSLFSDLNNLTDLSMAHPLSNDLLGITHEELLVYFADWIKHIAHKMKTPEKEILSAIKKWYNGYSFDGTTKLYNPFSLLNFFGSERFGYFWFATGTPTFLVETIRNRNINPIKYDREEVSETFLNKFSLKDLSMTGLLFQTGYLTIKEVTYRKLVAKYVLGYPNLEVRHAMMHNLVEAFTYRSSSVVSNALIKMQDGLEEGNVNQFMSYLKVILADLKYNWQPPKQYKTEAEVLRLWEGYFHAILYLITSSMELFVQAEIAHHKGRLDLVAETDDFIYLMEFKMDGSAEDAINQIKTKDYIAPYEKRGKKIFLVGINFSDEERNVEDWEVEERLI
ncbi:MAG: AAA family ATPase, partial [Bacteroidota bacterium]